MEKTKSSSRLIVKNIPKYLTEQQIQEKFQEFGTITDVKIMFKGKTNRQFCYVGFIKRKSAKKAKEYLNNTYIDTRKISVEYAKTHTEDKKLLERKKKFEKKKNKKVKTDKKAKYGEFAEFMDEMDLGDKNIEKVKEEDKVKLGKRESKTEKKPDGDLQNNRLYITNIPYILDKDALKEEFENYGKVTECIIPRDADYNSKGYAFITFEEESDAAKAMTLLDNTVVFGRILHIKPAMKPKRTNYANHGGNLPVTEEYTKTSFKKIKKRRFYENLDDDTNWNTLFLNPNTVMDYVAKEYGLSKKDLLDREVENPGVKIAMMETKVIQETKDWMAENNVDLSVFETDRRDCKRSDRVLLIKNLKTEVNKGKLELLFQRYGEIENLLLAPNKAIGIIEMKTSTHADNCFEKLQEYQLNGSPMYLEFAPVGMVQTKTKEGQIDEEMDQEEDKKSESSMGEDSSDTEEEKEESQDKKEKTSKKETIANLKGADQEEELVKGNTLFVKNLNFDTNEDGLLEFCNQNNFKNVKTCTVVRKNGNSRGFGFLEFYNDSQAEKALRALQGKLCDGHALELSISRPKKAKSENNRKQRQIGEENSKLMIRNIDFAATSFELKELMRAYGEVKQVRMPTKMTGEHRGYAFVEFTSIEEAKSAMAALSNTHFYGRKLVIEYARG